MAGCLVTPARFCWLAHVISRRAAFSSPSFQHQYAIHAWLQAERECVLPLSLQTGQLRCLDLPFAPHVKALAPPRCFVPVSELPALQPVTVWISGPEHCFDCHVSSSAGRARVHRSLERPFQFWAPSLKHCGIRKVSLAVCLHWPGSCRWDTVPAAASLCGSFVAAQMF